MLTTGCGTHGEAKTHKARQEGCCRGEGTWLQETGAHGPILSQASCTTLETDVGRCWGSGFWGARGLDASNSNWGKERP